MILSSLRWSGLKIKSSFLNFLCSQLFVLLFTWTWFKFWWKNLVKISWCNRFCILWETYTVVYSSKKILKFDIQLILFLIYYRPIKKKKALNYIFSYIFLVIYLYLTAACRKPRVRDSNPRPPTSNSALSAPSHFKLVIYC